MPSLRHPATRVLASSLITQAGLVVTGPLTVRLLGVEARGEVALIVATVLLISQVGPWGLPQAFAYFIARGDTDPRALLDAYLGRYLRKTVLIAVLGALGILAASRFATDLTHPLAEALLAMTGIASIMVAVLALACLTGAKRFNALAVLQAVPGLSYTVAIIVVAFIGRASILLILVLFFISWFAVAVIGVWLVRRPGPATVADVPALPVLRSYARRAFVTAAAPIDNLGLDQLAVGLILSHTELGLYIVALAFETGPVLVLLALTSVCTPTVASITDPAAQRAHCRRWIVIGAGTGLAVVAAIQLVIDPGLELAFGSEAAAAVPATRILVTAGLFLGLRRLTAGMLQGMGRPLLATWAETSGLAVFVVLIFPLSRQWGVEGSCFVMLLAGLVATVTSLVMILWPQAASASPESVALSEPR